MEPNSLWPHDKMEPPCLKSCLENWIEQMFIVHGRVDRMVG